MKKNIFVILATILLINAELVAFDTQYPELDNFSHEWQQAGYDNGNSEIPFTDEEINVTIEDDIQYKIDNASANTNNIVQKN